MLNNVQARGGDTNFSKDNDTEEVAILGSKTDQYKLLKSYIDTTMTHILNTDTNLVYKFWYAPIDESANDTIETASGRIRLDLKKGITMRYPSSGDSTSFIDMNYKIFKNTNEVRDLHYATIGHIIFTFNIFNTRFCDFQFKREFKNTSNNVLKIEKLAQDEKCKIFSFYEEGDNLKVRLYFDAEKTIDSIQWSLPTFLVKADMSKNDKKLKPNDITVKTIYTNKANIMPLRIEESYFYNDSVTNMHTHTILKLELDKNANIKPYVSNKKEKIELTLPISEAYRRFIK